MKEFDLEAAKNGAAVCTRDGRKVQIISYEIKSEKYPILALIEQNPEETPETYTKTGRSDVKGFTQDDLKMAPVKHEAWVRLNTICPECCPRIYKSEDEAWEGIQDGIQVAHIEWEDDE